jgi:hypothetical protein
LQPAGKALHQGVAHQTNRSVAVGLKHQQQAAGKRVHGFERGRDLVGIVGKVVDHGDAIGFAHDLQPAADTAELAEMGRRCSQGHAARLRRAQCGERVGHVVQPRNFQGHLDGLIAIARLDMKGYASGRPHRRRCGEVGLRSTQAVGHRLTRLQAGQERRGFCVVEIQHHGLRVGNETAEQDAQLVQRFMVQGDVVHDGDAGLEKRNRAVALVHFTDENLALPNPGAGKR